MLQCALTMVYITTLLFILGMLAVVQIWSVTVSGGTPKGHLPNALKVSLNGTDCNLCKCHNIEPKKGKLEEGIK